MTACGGIYVSEAKSHHNEGGLRPLKAFSDNIPYMLYYIDALSAMCMYIIVQENHIS